MRVCVVVLWVIGPALAPGAQIEQLTVCQVLKNLKAYDGKLIAIRGEWAGGSRHGHYISDVYEDRPCPGMPKTGVTVPSTIYPADPDNQEYLKGVAIPFRQDYGALADFRGTVAKLRGDPNRRVSATFIGEVRTRKGIRIVCEADGACGGNGYGQFGMHSAILVLKTIKDVVVK